ncbi:MAG: DUF2577 domain-containing protein [Peptostreptococcaceae bacterium]|nr:DUF2577 domain-containing protein [Peptostreptococcaceae bacterium]
MNNPFLGLYEVMAEATKVEASFFIAKITSPLPNIKIQLNDIELDKDDLLIDKWLKDRNEDLFTENEGHSHGGDTTGNGEHKHQIKEPIQDKLKADDKVLLLKIDDKFIILSKVVSI